MKKTNILATLGPASTDYEVMKKLIKAGVTAFRLNCSHATHPELTERVANIRKLGEELGQYIPILLDLQGPKIRLGKMEDESGFRMEIGEKIRLDTDPTPGNRERLGFPHEDVYSALKTGATLLVDDGKMRFVVVEEKGDHMIIEAKVAGTVKPRKGVNLPDVTLPISPLTPKDLADLEHGLTLDIDWVALSFVQTAEDIRECKAIVGDKARVLAKVEKPNAIDNIDEIIKESDAIMIARGDLGVEMPFFEVPHLQNIIIRKCRQANKLVVVATQMLESMIEAPVPTRAETTDVAYATYLGADSVMLSAESASGQYPEEAVMTMRAIIEATEDGAEYKEEMKHTRPVPNDHSISKSIAHAAINLHDTLKIRAFVAVSEYGFSARSMSATRPTNSDLYCLTNNPKTANAANLYWGMTCLLSDKDISDPQVSASVAKHMLTKRRAVKKGDLICMIASFQHEETESRKTNSIRLLEV